MIETIEESRGRAYSTFSDAALAREAQSLERRVSVLQHVDSPAGVRLHRELVKRLDEARAALERRRV